MPLVYKNAFIKYGLTRTVIEFIKFKFIKKINLFRI